MKLKCSMKKNVIYWLIHIDFQVQEIFPETVTKSDKQTRAAHSFVYRICNPLGK